MDKLRSLEFLIAATDTGSFAGAAKKFATDPSTVSKSIRKLEEQLALQLFQRSTRKLSLTDAGKQYVDSVKHFINQLEITEDNLKAENESSSGTLKINLPVSYGRLVIQPLLSQFRRLYPDIAMEITFSDEYVDIIGESIDLTIRSGSLSDSRLVAQKLAPMDFIICATPEYLKRHSSNISDRTLEQHNWIRFRFKQTGKTMPVLMQTKDGVKQLDPGNQIVVDDGEVQAEFCAAGLGISQLTHFNARSWVEAGKLEVVTKACRLKGASVYVVYAKRDRLPARTRLLLDFIKEGLVAIGETPSSTWASWVNNN